jgi:branched-chain amino acid transport system substrate-binding protein
MRRFTLYLILAAIAALALFGAACGDDDDDDGDDDGSPTATESDETGDASGDDPTQPGGAGIASDPREVLGDIVADDGDAMFAERDEGEDRTGVEDDSVKICNPITQTGQAAFYAGPSAVMEGTIEALNEAGGIHGRQIEFVVKDDGGTPDTATTAIRELVEDEECFLIFGHSSGSGVFAAVAPYMEQQGVPYFMFSESGSYIGEPPTERAWPGVNPAAGAFLAFGRLIYELNPDEELGIIYYDDPYTEAARAGLSAANEEFGKEFAGEVLVQSNQPDYNGPIGQLLESNPTGIVTMGLIADLPKYVTSIRETYGSDAQIYDPGGNVILSAQAIPDLLGGIISFNFSTVRETATDNATVVAMNQIQSDAGLTPAQFSLALGSVYVEHLIRALECAGPDLTREGFTAAVDGGCFDGSWECTTCLGPTVLNAYDHWSMETIQGQEYDDAVSNWVPIGDTVRFETSEGNSVRGNIEDFDCSDELSCPWEEDCTLESEDRCLFRAAHED